ncbi:hypothetical protein [Vineibacter terrae]|uniref:hypothetical protein n=1 Tax=Vineibacter terrae TaxID=2586908 RepID=UPI002E348526|nr:hypothetical protein [Vineibacter terrae]HEX2890963.1 hypothetical protein [Vineibacter terrae]
MTKSASSRRAAPHRKSAAATGARSAAKGSASGTDWDRLAGQTDAEIEAAVAADPDAAPIDDAFWSTARVVRHPQGRPVLVRLDVEVVQWLRRQKDSDARVNDILRDRMKAEARSATKRKASR